MDPAAKSTSSNMKGMAAVVGVVLLVVGLAVGFGITKASDNNKIKTANNKADAMSAPTSATNAADLRSTLVTLGLEHMNYTDQAVDAALDGSPNAAAADALLNQNGKDIGAAVGSVYGMSAETTFDTVWQIHLNDFVAYAVADKEGNTAAAQAALTDIATKYTKPLATYLASANPKLPEATLESALSDHVAMTATMIDDHVKGNYTAEATELGMANMHMEGLFSTLAEGIVQQFPSKFAN